MKDCLYLIENYNYSLEILENNNILLYSIPNEYYIIVGGNISFQCVGLFIDRLFSIFIFPKNYLIPSDDKKKAVESTYILKSIIRYNKKKSKKDNIFINQLKTINQYDSYVYSMMHVIEYFKENGLLSNYNNIYRKNTGKKINWNKTFKKSIPIFSNNNTYYLDTYTQINVATFDGIITLLNKLALIISINKIGFLYDINQHEIKNEKLILEDFNKNKEKYKYLLNQLYSNTFNYKKLEILKSIKCILFDDQSRNEFRSTISLVNCNFELIWEDIVSVCFGNDFERYKSDFPTLDINYKGQIERRSQIPDIVYQNELNKWVILDAKYYDIDNSRPNKGDYLKQYFYEFSFKYSKDCTINALIFNYHGNELEYLGYTKINNIDNLLLKNKLIHLIGMDQSKAYKSYSRNIVVSEYYRFLLNDIISNYN